MTDNNTGDDKKLSVSTGAKPTLSLKRPGIEQSTVRQNFSHGRTKAVVVETKKSKFGRPDEKAKQVFTPVQPAAPAAPVRPQASAPAPVQPRVETRAPQPPRNNSGRVDRWVAAFERLLHRRAWRLVRQNHVSSRSLPYSPFHACRGRHFETAYPVITLT